MQLGLSLIEHNIEGSLVPQRAADGYVNATAMCKAVGKRMNDYLRTGPTNEFLNELSSVTGIPVTDLVITVQGGKPQEQGTWVHPDVAINLGQWLSPKFAVAVSRWVRDWMTGKIAGNLPYHLRRYMANRSEIPHTHFSILNEMTFGIIAPLEEAGYTLPDSMLPDISMGRIFSKWLRDVKGLDTDSLPTYRHSYEDGRIVMARLYPNSVLADFRRHLNEDWIPNRAAEYFEKRDSKSLPFMKKLLPSVQFKQMIEEEAQKPETAIPKESPFASIRKALEDKSGQNKPPRR